jgi:hypothetical protein
MAIWSSDRWRELAGVCSGFIFATIWFDMMFDVQIFECCAGSCQDGDVKDRVELLSNYYGQVTWNAPTPMRILLGFVMVLGIFSSYFSWKRHPVLKFLQPLLLIVVALMAAIKTFPSCYRLGHRSAKVSDDILSVSCSVLFEHILQCSLVLVNILLHLFCVPHSQEAIGKNN